jgi:hypothetical protein
MKKTPIAFLFALLMFVSWRLAAQSDEQIFAGHIMDSHCAMLGSHNAGIDQLKKEGEAEANSVDCTRACMRKGDKYVLYNFDQKLTYQLDFGSQRANQWAGEDVKLVGTLDKATNTIHIKAIYPGYWTPER